MQEKGHQFLFVVRERDSTIELIKSTGFDYVTRGKGGTNLFSKLLLIPVLDRKLYRAAKRFRPDMFMSMSSPYAAHTAWLMRKPHIALDDTEIANLGHLLYRPFTSTVLSPSCYYAKLHKNMILFNSFLEFCYLHEHYFTPNRKIRDVLGINQDDKYIVLRLISWEANHDVGQHGLRMEDKIKLVKELEKYCKVFISSEKPLVGELQQYKLNIHPSQLHDVLSDAELYIGEGSTTASEAVVLGTPAILINSLRVGYINEEAERGLLYQLEDINEILNTSINILESKTYKDEYMLRHHKLMNDKIDITSFLVWFVENYPGSRKTMTENSDYQNRFK